MAHPEANIASQTRRRQILVSVCALFALPASSVRAQAPQQARIGYLSVGKRLTGPSGPPPLISSALRELGWVEGRNLTIEWRFADGQLAKLPELAADLVQLGVQVIVTSESLDAEAAHRATRRIPIVMVSAFDPVKAGLAQSFAHPGGNVTGVMWADPSFSAKSLQILKETVPGIKRVGFLYTPSASAEPHINAIKAAAQELGISPVWFPITRHEQVPAALEAAKKNRIDALRFSSWQPILPAFDQILEFAVLNRLPTSCPVALCAERGGLLSYSPMLSENITRAASLVDQILRGANPADLPFEYPKRYELVINLKTAKAIGIAVPQTLILRADRVIE